MNPDDIRSVDDVVRWLRYHVEWSSCSSEDMATRAIDVLEASGWSAGSSRLVAFGLTRCGKARTRATISCEQCGRQQ